MLYIPNEPGAELYIIFKMLRLLFIPKQTLLYYATAQNVSLDFLYYIFSHSKIRASCAMALTCQNQKERSGNCTRIKIFIFNFTEEKKKKYISYRKMISTQKQDIDVALNACVRRHFW